tara:strand:+ start:243 stop:416 length:174 start_codon:yes stop_codon:yes gene_type:complete
MLVHLPVVPVLFELVAVQCNFQWIRPDAIHMQGITIRRSDTPLLKKNIVYIDCLETL